MSAAIFGLYGLIVGSFLNVLVLRWGKEGLGGRSRCPHCKSMIAWYDNIPLLSYLVLRGRCRACKAGISLQYPLVELSTALVFALFGVSVLALATKILACLVAALLIAVAVYDLYTKLIPNAWSYTFCALAFCSQFPPFTHTVSFTAFYGASAALPLLALFLISRGAWMGFGDVILGIGIGFLLGPLYGFVAVMFAFVIGALISVPLVMYSRYVTPTSASRSSSGAATIESAERWSMKSEIPFGPFLALSTLLIWSCLIFSIDPLALVGLDIGW